MKLFGIRNCILTLISLLLLCGCASRGASVDVYNKSNSEIYNLVLEYTGGKKVTRTLLPQHHVKQKINPTGESTVIIEFALDGKNYRQDLDVYFENDYGGYLTININEGGKIDFEDHIELPYQWIHDILHGHS